MTLMFPRITRTGRVAAATLAAAALATAALAGCSGSDGAAPEPAPGPTTAPATSATPAATLPKGVTPAPIPTKVANDPNDRKNVVMSGCAATKTGWGASGTATNPGKEDVTYTVTVFFTTTAATTIDSASTKVEVKAGDTVKWTADKAFKAPKEMLCVLRGVAAS